MVEGFNYEISAMYTAFLAVARACGTPAMLAALALGQVGGWWRLKINIIRAYDGRVVEGLKRAFSGTVT